LNLKDLNLQGSPVIYEPFGKNTAPAIAVLCRILELKSKAQEVVGVFPSDHLIQDEIEFSKIVAMAEKLAQQDRIVTIGIQPTYPETGYGYIQVREQTAVQDHLKSFSVLRFHEKPPLAKAQEFLTTGGFYWNAGIFVFKVARMIELFKQHQPTLWGEIQKIKEDLSNIAEIYQSVQSISIDYAIMEKLSEQELHCIPGSFGWNDVGSWDAVSTLLPSLNTESYESSNNFVFGDSGKKYSLVGIQDMILVDTKDAMMLVKKGHSQDVKQVVDSLTKAKSNLVKDHVFEKRPWGDYEILRDTEHFKSKVIHVRPQSQISYQSHAKREEHWIITRGQGEVVLNDQVIPIKAGSHIHIPIGAKHRIRNNSNEMIEFVEVQISERGFKYVETANPCAEDKIAKNQATISDFGFWKVFFRSYFHSLILKRKGME
jgi:mannose-1-phosphate guanylyltransferase/mannose-1-phosphate guanylyltransferase/mannose-6-phosphate isomerase